MVSNQENWIQIFDVEDITKHKKGFTIYKTLSMLYPKNHPDSVTKVTVWKRYNDFKKFHRDIKAHQKLLKMNVKVPNLPSASYFNRFDENVIQQRRLSILNFLEFLAKYPQLYTSVICVNFFKTSYTPYDLMNSNIQSIRSELNLPVEDYTLIRSNSDEDRTVSDTDSISTLSSIMDQLPDPLNHCTSSITMAKKFEISNLANSHTSSHDSLNLSVANVSVDAIKINEDQMFPSPPETPNLNTASLSYIADGANYISQAIDFEIAKKFEKAFTAYKIGIDMLLQNVKDDKDLDRKEMVRHKVEKYLLRAEKIYNLHLSSESKTIQNYISEKEEAKQEIVHRSMSELYKYKVIKIISSGMLVLHSDSQELFYIKVIYKTSKFPNDKSVILPGNVPYMVKLFNYYNCENAFFLVLQYCSGIKLSDYTKQVQNIEDHFNTSFCSNTSSYGNIEEEGSDSDSDHSYSDLIHNYTITRFDNFKSENKNCQYDNNDNLTSDMTTASNNNNATSDIIFQESLAIHSTHRNSSSINDTKSITHDLVQKNPQNNIDMRITQSRKSSDRSEWSSFDDMFDENSSLPIQDIIKWAAQLLLAVERLHSLGVICCDLQSKNILIDECGDLMLTYMCNVTEKYNIAFSNGNNLIVAPEMHTFQPISEAVDWWSYGAILYEMLVGMPLKDVHPHGLTAYTILKVPRYVSVEGRSVLKQLLAYESHERLGCGINGAEDIKTHPFFNTIVWDTLGSKYKT